MFIFMAFISCRDKKNANNVVAESTDTEVAIATLKAFYSSVYNGSLDNREVLFKQYVSKQLLEKIDELSADMTLDYDPFIDGQDFFADVLNSTLKITPLENKNEYRCCFLLFGDTDEKETCVDLLLEKDKEGHFVISKILNDDILAGKRDVMPSDDDSDLGKILFRNKKIKEWNLNKTPNITTPEDIVITEEGIIQNDNGEMIQFKNITEVINRIQKFKPFTLKKMYQHDLNQDGNKDIFLVFENIIDPDSFLVDPIVILLIHQGGDKYRFFHNEKIYPKIDLFSFRRIAFKDNFFTIELDTEAPDEYTAEKYITFKYSKNKIVLHRFGRIYYLWKKNIKTSNDQLTQEDFGEILFEDYDSELMNQM